MVLERGEVASSWKTERWNSLTLLTPNWQSRLPSYGGYVVATNQGDWQCQTVVLATGACNIPHVPAVADALPETMPAT